MSQYLCPSRQAMKPYVPGEQPQDRRYIKLNTNESPFPPSEGVLEAVSREADKLQLYSDPESGALTRALASFYYEKPENILVTNGSDEAIVYTFLAYADRSRGFATPDATYGFYRTVAEFCGTALTEIALTEDFQVDVPAFCQYRDNIILPNPGAPTGVFLPLSQIEKLLESHPDRIVAVDEAYVDFGAESALKLLDAHENLLIIRTYSKSRSMAGARLGFFLGSAAVIRDLRTVKNSLNPYNVSRLDQAAGLAALEKPEYYRRNCRIIIENREWTASQLKKRGITVLPSAANFLFLRPGFMPGGDFYLAMKEKGILIRHWNEKRIQDWCRVTIGSREEMEMFLKALDELREEKGAGTL